MSLNEPPGRRSTTPLETVSLEVQRLRYQLALSQLALDRIAVGVVVTDSMGNVIIENRKARALLRQHVLLDTPKQHGMPQRCRLREFFEKLQRASNEPIMRTIRVEENDRLLHLFVVPLRVDRDERTAPRLIVLNDPERRLSASGDMLQALFELTTAEARFVLELLNGCSVDEAAASLGITPNTARSHLKRAFAKTGTNRQGELIRLVTATLAAVDI